MNELQKQIAEHIGTYSGGPDSFDMQTADIIINLCMDAVLAKCKEKAKPTEWGGYKTTPYLTLKNIEMIIESLKVNRDE